MSSFWGPPQIIHKIPCEILATIVKEDSSEMIQRLQIMLNGNRIDVIDNNPEFKEYSLQGVLDGKLSLYPSRNKSHSLQFITTFLHPHFLSIILNQDGGNSSFVRKATSLYSQHSANSNAIEFKVNDSIDEKIRNFMVKIYETINSEYMVWKSSLNPWEILVESGRNIFGDCWSLNLVAVISAGIKSKEEKADGYENLNDKNLSLCKRVRCARMKSGNVTYWKEQLLESENLDFSLLVFLTWATPKTINLLLHTVTEILDSILPDHLDRIVKALKETSRVSYFTPAQQRYIEKSFEGKNVSSLVKYLLCMRFPEYTKNRFVYKNIDSYTGDIQDVLTLKLKYLINKFASNMSEKTLLAEIRDIYVRIKNSNEDFYYYRRYLNNNKQLPLDIAKVIMADCKNYPRSIASFAEKSCRLEAYNQLKPVGEIAEIENWFV